MQNLGRDTSLRRRLPRVPASLTMIFAIRIVTAVRSRIVSAVSRTDVQFLVLYLLVTLLTAQTFDRR